MGKAFFFCKNAIVLLLSYMKVAIPFPQIGELPLSF